MCRLPLAEDAFRVWDFSLTWAPREEGLAATLADSAGAASSHPRLKPTLFQGQWPGLREVAVVILRTRDAGRSERETSPRSSFRKHPGGTSAVGTSRTEPSLCRPVPQGVPSLAVAGPGSALQVARDVTRSQPRRGRVLGPGVTFFTLPCLFPVH